MRAQSMVVSGTCHGNAEKVLIIVHRLQHSAEKEQELRVLCRGVPRFQEVDSRIGGDRPIIMLTASVDSFEGFFVEQAYHIVFLGDFLHNLHRQLIVIDGDVRGCVNGSEFMLGGRGVVMLGLGD